MEQMTLEGLCREIGLAEAVTAEILDWEKQLDWGALGREMDLLASPGCWEDGLRRLAEKLAPDERGLKMLACCLRQAMKTWEAYQAIGISRDIYGATMACFSRFVEEHMESFGVYGFDRAFWTVRQLSAKLFRIGELEYELVEKEGEKQVHLHIPSGSRLYPEILRQSVAEAKALLGCCFPEYAQAPILCDSWLLSPTLKELLPEDSRILTFQRSFRTKALGEGDSFMQWVYKRRDLPLENLPEGTGLQRRLKAYLLSGGRWIEADGQLVDDPFTAL